MRRLTLTVSQNIGLTKLTDRMPALNTHCFDCCALWKLWKPVLLKPIYYSCVMIHNKNKWLKVRQKIIQNASIYCVMPSSICRCKKKQGLIYLYTYLFSYASNEHSHFLKQLNTTANIQQHTDPQNSTVKWAVMRPLADQDLSQT